MLFISRPESERTTLFKVCLPIGGSNEVEDFAVKTEHFY